MSKYFAFLLLAIICSCSAQRGQNASTERTHIDKPIIYLRTDREIAYYLAGIGDIKEGVIYQIEPVQKAFKIYRINADSTVTVW